MTDTNSIQITRQTKTNTPLEFVLLIFWNLALSESNESTSFEIQSVTDIEREKLMKLCGSRSKKSATS